MLGGPGNRTGIDTGTPVYNNVLLLRIQPNASL